VIERQSFGHFGLLLDDGPAVHCSLQFGVFVTLSQA
jgi:hypothetical protein